MVNFYVLQIKLGKIALEEVPKRWRSVVADKLHGNTDIEYNRIMESEELPNV